MSATEIVQAWDVRLPYRDAEGGTQWQCVIAHSDGALLMSRNLVTHFCQPDPVTFKVFPGDSPVPEVPGLAAPVCCPPVPGCEADSECVTRWQNEQTPCPYELGDGRVLVTVGPNQYSPSGWINDESFDHCEVLRPEVAIQTCGNNAWVHTLAERRPAIGTDAQARLLSPSLNWADPLTLKNAAVVHAFVVANEWHERMMGFGFEEAAGNFHQINYSGQGLGSDPPEIVVDGGTGSAANSGTTAPTGDGRAEDGHAFTILYGSSPRIPAFDRTVLYHELGHALSLRLHVNYYFGPVEANGLSEGWSDFMAIALLTGATTPTPSRRHVVAAGETAVVFEDDMDPAPVVLPGNNRWTVEPLPPSPGAWVAVNPNGSPTTPARDATSGTGQVRWATEDRDWEVQFPSVLDHDVDPNGAVKPLSPEFLVPDGQTAIIDYKVWFFDRNPSASANQPFPDDIEFIVEWLRDGEVRESWAWTPDFAERRWQRHRRSVGTSNGTGPARLRFRFQDPGQGSVVEGGIDDVLVRCTVSCEECCDADVNIDGNVDQDDVTYLIQVVGGGPNPSGIDPDWNKDGNVDQDDVQSLVN